MSPPYYYITPYDPKAWEDPNDLSEKPTSDLYIDCDDFRRALSVDWKNRFQERGYEGCVQVLSYEENPKEWSLGVFLYGDNQIVSFNLDIVMIEFVLWYRRFVPEKYTLYFFNSSSWERLVLTSQTTRQDILEFSGLKFDPP